MVLEHGIRAEVSRSNLRTVHIDLLHKVGGAVTASTLQAQRTFVWDGMLENKPILEPLTIGLWYCGDQDF